MRPALHQVTALKQEMRQNPRLYQAMDLLYMPMLDLQLHLKTELMENPFLEMEEPEEETEVPRETTPEEHEKERAETERQDEIDWEEIVLDGFDVGRSRGQVETRDVYEPVTVATRDLTDHLRDQVTLLDLTPRQQLLADEILGNIGDDGYLQATLEEVVQGANLLAREHLVGVEASTRTPEEVEPDAESAQETVPAAPDASLDFQSQPPSDNGPTPVEREEDGEGFFTVAEAEVVLTIIQQLDPPGIGARDLRECLLLQLQDQGDEDTLTYRLVEDRDVFEDLIAHRWSDLAKRFSLNPRKVQDAADMLAKLNPKPGLRYSTTGDSYIIPDIVVEETEGDYRVFLNDTGMPRLRISKTYRELAGDKKRFAGATREFVTNKLNSAAWLVQAIEQRRQTVLKVMNFIVDRQRDFFEKGVEHLKPLTLREVADVINMHESTVSRVTNQKYAQTPRGVLPLKFFFSAGLGRTGPGENASARAVKAQINKLVSNEDTSSPLTDSDIVKALSARGVKIARRTVAKYRDQLNILPARMRKRV
ncbi:MAG: RNA polymerase factor sigma-54 [Gemmatimonadetes bacterium]|nr:RNA polymerase factor sigma-54 [Gemmatimonadota bacterium]